LKKIVLMAGLVLVLAFSVMFVYASAQAWETGEATDAALVAPDVRLDVCYDINERLDIGYDLNERLDADPSGGFSEMPASAGLWMPFISTRF
jgi:hypothetical protein